MVISRASADAPKTYSGIPATQAHDTTYQEGEITRANPNIPVQTSGQTIVRSTTGVSQPGLQQYSEP